MNRRPLAAFAFALSSALVAFFAAAGEAHAFCRNTTMADETSPTSCNEGIPVWWRNACVGIGLANAPIRDMTGEQVLKAAREALARWTMADCGDGAHPSIDVRYIGSIECYPNCETTYGNILLFREKDWPGVKEELGKTYSNFVIRTGEMQSARVEINAYHHQFYMNENGPPQGGATGGRSLQSLEFTLTHELGHFLGIGHSAEPNAVMYFAENGRNDATLTEDDIAAICDAFPPDRTRTVPTSVNSSGKIEAGMCNPRVDAFPPPDQDQGRGLSCTMTRSPAHVGPETWLALWPAFALAALTLVRSFVGRLRRSRREFDPAAN